MEKLLNSLAVELIIFTGVMSGLIKIIISSSLVYKFVFITEENKNVRP